MTYQMQDNKSWINIAKMCSVFGVVIQHVRGYLYSNDAIFYSVWWSVALFVMIGGYNAYTSYKKRGTFLLKKKLFGIFFPYFLATSLYVFFYLHYFDVTAILHNLLHFTAADPFYYVAVYIQLLVVSPILIGVIEFCNKKRWRFVIAWLIVLCIGAFTTNYTNILDIIIGGGNLFGGPWMLFWFMGMCISYCEGCIVVNQRCEKWIVFIISTAVMGWQYYFVICGKNLQLDSMYHGTQLAMTWANAFETVLLFFWFKHTVGVFERKTGRGGRVVLRPLDYIGKNTLYIFLYHMLFLKIYQMYFDIHIPKINRWLCLVFIIGGPLILGLILKKCKDFMVSIMQEIDVE